MAGLGGSGTTGHLLIVDDDPRLLALLERYLRQHDYIVSTASDAAAAKAQLANLAFDLIILDVMLPDEDGISLTRGLRRTSQVPILLLTARGEPEDRIRGLEGGADDYLVKPFEPRELLLRIATILRRTRVGEPGVIVRFGPWAFDGGTGELTRDGQPVHLTTGEASLLSILAQQAGRSLSRAELGARSKISGSDRAVDVQIVRLRRKLEDDPRQPRWLLTVRGEGYALRSGA